MQITIFLFVISKIEAKVIAHATKFSNCEYLVISAFASGLLAYNKIKFLFTEIEIILEFE